MSFQNIWTQRVILVGPDFILECFSAFTSRPEKVKGTHVATKVRGRGWHDKGKGCSNMLSNSGTASINTRLCAFPLLIIFILPSVNGFLLYFLTLFLRFVSYLLLILQLSAG